MKSVPVHSLNLFVYSAEGTLLSTALRHKHANGKALIAPQIDSIQQNIHSIRKVANEQSYNEMLDNRKAPLKMCNRNELAEVNQLWQKIFVCNLPCEPAKERQGRKLVTRFARIHFCMGLWVIRAGGRKWSPWLLSPITVSKAHYLPWLDAVLTHPCPFEFHQALAYSDKWIAEYLTLSELCDTKVQSVSLLTMSTPSICPCVLCVLRYTICIVCYTVCVICYSAHFPYYPGRVCVLSLGELMPIPGGGWINVDS